MHKLNIGQIWQMPTSKMKLDLFLMKWWALGIHFNNHFTDFISLFKIILKVHGAEIQFWVVLHRHHEKQIYTLLRHYLGTWKSFLNTYYYLDIHFFGQIYGKCFYRNFEMYSIWSGLGLSRWWIPVILLNWRFDDNYQEIWWLTTKR